MKEKGDAIGNNMIRLKHEYFREILQAHMEITSDQPDPIKFRSYFMHHNKNVLTYIEETFLPDIEKYLK